MGLKFFATLPHLCACEHRLFPKGTGDHDAVRLVTCSGHTDAIDHLLISPGNRHISRIPFSTVRQPGEVVLLSTSPASCRDFICTDTAHVAHPFGLPLAAGTRIR